MLMAMLVLLGQVSAATPDLATVRGWFESSEHERVSAVALTDTSDPALVYLVARSFERLERPNDTRGAYARLDARPETDPWHHIGRSALLLSESRQTDAIDAASSP